MSLLANTSLRRKQMAITMLTTGVALALACAAIGAYEVITFRKSTVQHLTTLAEMVDSGSSAALDFDDPKGATETLGVLTAEPSVVAAWICDRDGKVFARYGRVETEKNPVQPGSPKGGSYFTQDRLVVVDPIDSKGETVGTVYLVADLEELYSRLTRYAVITGGVFAVSLLIAFLLAGRLQRVISEPILNLVRTARAVARDKDYSVRVTRRTRDEIGALIDGFNDMLAEIQERDAVLKQAHAELEGRVRERTQELASSLSLVHATLESTADAILVADGAGHATNWNEKFMRMWGIPQDVMERRDEKAMLDIALPQLCDPEQFVVKIQLLYNQPEAESFDILEFKDGRAFERISKPQHVGERCVGRVWTFHEITEQRRAQNELRLRTALLEAQLESSLDGILVVDEHMKKLYQNRRVVDLWKIPPEIANDPDDTKQAEYAMNQTCDPEAALAEVKRLYAHPMEVTKLEMELKDGTWLDRHSYPVVGKDGTRYGRIWQFRDITDRKRAEHELRWKTAVLEAQLDSSPDGVLVMGEGGRKLFQNRRVGELWGIPQEISDDPDSMRQIEFAASRTANPQETLELIRHINACPDEAHHSELELVDGTWLDRHSYPIIGKDGTRYGRIWTFRDMTARKRAEAELSWKTAVLEAQLESSRDGIIVADPAGRKIFQNQRVAELWKLPKDIAEDPDTTRQIQFVASKTRNPEGVVERAMQITRDSSRVHEAELELLDGTFLERHSNPIIGRDGTHFGRIWSFRDITDRKRAEMGLAFERDLLEKLLENSPDLIYFKDRDSKFLRCSRSLAERFGMNPVDMVGLSDFDIHSPEHARECMRDEQEIIQSGNPLIGKIEGEDREDGRALWVLTSKMPLRDKDGNIVGTFGTSKDITAIKKAEADLARERDLLETLLQNSPDYIYFKDRQSRFMRCSLSLARRLAVDWAQLIGKTDFDLYTEEHARPAFQDEQEIIRTGKPIIGKIEKEVSNEGRVTWVITSKMPLCGKDGTILGTFGISKDITEMKEAEGKLEQAHKQLLETSRLAGMAEVATSVLHNVGNVLNSVNVSCSVVADRVRKSRGAGLSKLVDLIRQNQSNLGFFFTDDPKGRQVPAYLASLADHLTQEQKDLLDELSLLSANVEHIKQIVAMQQSYSKVSGVRETLPAEVLLEDAIRMNGAALERHQVKVIREFEKSPPVQVEKHKVLQILINLIRNAKYACDEGGRDDKQLILRIAKANERMVQLTVKDNGVGIPAENLTRIFEHGFTTRKEGHGFGLHSGALAAKDLGGSLTVESAGPGQGATFTLTLPCATADTLT